MIKVAKRIIIFAVSAAVGLVFIACSQDASKLDRMRANIEFVNNQKAKIYMYNVDFEDLENNIKKIERLTSIAELTLDDNFVALAITKEYYGHVDEGFIEKLFDLLSNYKNKFFIAFLNFDDLNFLQYTIFENDKQNYPPKNFVTSIDNFDGEIKLSGSNIQIGNDNAEYDEQIVNSFAKRILEYNQAQ